MVSEDDSQLIQRAKGGSSGAVNQLFERYGPKLLGLIRLRLGPHMREQVESVDVLQQTMLKAFQGFDRFEGAHEPSLMAWLGKIAQNQIVDQARYAERQRRDAAKRVDVEDIDGLIADRIRSEVSRIHFNRQAQRLERALEALSEAHREVVVLRRFEELEYAEIGDRMGKSADACRMLYARAIAALTIQMHASEAEQVKQWDP